MILCNPIPPKKKIHFQKLRVKSVISNVCIWECQDTSAPVMNIFSLCQCHYGLKNTCIIVAILSSAQSTAKRCCKLLYFQNALGKHAIFILAAEHIAKPLQNFVADRHVSFQDRLTSIFSLLYVLESWQSFQN